ncbi:hypothetical protein ABZP36_035784 [Zizania latifolia]
MRCGSSCRDAAPGGAGRSRRRRPRNTPAFADVAQNLPCREKAHEKRTHAGLRPLPLAAIHLSARHSATNMGFPFGPFSRRGPDEPISPATAPEPRCRRFGKDPCTWFGKALQSNSSPKGYFAAQSTIPGSYYGFVVTMDVYGFNLSKGQKTMASIWITNPGDDICYDLNTIWVGWQISPEIYGDSNTHFFTYWLRDANQTTGCYDMKCPGFRLANGSAIAPGAIINPVSDVNGGRQKIMLKVFREKSTGNWWIHYGLNSSPKAVGYYPADLFKNLSKETSFIAFGGAVSGSPAPPMGAGTLPPAGDAASMHDIALVDEDGNTKPFDVDTYKLEMNSACYSVTPVVGAKCSYGGPGGCTN